VKSVTKKGLEKPGKNGKRKNKSATYRKSTRRLGKNQNLNYKRDREGQDPKILKGGQGTDPGKERAKSWGDLHPVRAAPEQPPWPQQAGG